MTKQIRLNAFNMATPGSQASSLWNYRGNRVGNYNTLGYWKDLCKILERGLFDTLFLADVLGAYDVYGGNPDAALRRAVSVPILDPVQLIPALADNTTNLGFGVTCTLTYEPPHVFARRMSTLDHLTDGRIGWNIVTGFLQSAGKAAGHGQIPGHDRRYDIAEEYMEVVYRLWEGSWEDDAACRDSERGWFTDPSKVHTVRFEGEFFSTDTIHLCEPSQQRTPVLYQAGAVLSQESTPKASSPAVRRRKSSPTRSQRFVPSASRQDALGMRSRSIRWRRRSSEKRSRKPSANTTTTAAMFSTKARSPIFRV